MTLDDSAEEAVVHAFLGALAADQQSGGCRGLLEYQAAFPGHEAAIAREFAALFGGGQSGALRIGPYEVRRELGLGGQAVVYLAVDPRLDREVALKVLPVGIASLQQELRLRREAATTAKLHDPGICPVYDVGRDGDWIYMAMRYVPGETLAGRIARARQARDVGGVLPLPWVLATFEQLCRSLHRAHAAGVVHRDLKPANVMLGEDGQPVLLDFGMALEVTGEGPLLTRSGDVFGTPAYLAPERLLGRVGSGDARTDVFAVGVTLFEALTATRPFAAPTVEALYRAILTAEPADPRRSRPGLPRDLAHVLAVCLEKRPERRYQSAEALADDLHAVASGEPIRARPPGLLRRVARLHRRHAAVAAAGWVLLLGLGGVIAEQRVALAQVRAANADTEGINEFLVEKLLLAVTPEEARGREVTAAEVFDAAMRNVARSLPEPSRVSGAVNQALGRANEKLRRNQAAKECFERAIAGYTAALGPEHPATMTAVAGLVQALRRLDDAAGAERLGRELLDRRTRVLGPDHKETLATRRMLAEIAQAAGRYAFAERMARELAADSARAIGPDHADTLTAIHLQALAISEQARRPLAEELMRDVLARRRRTLGEDALPTNDSRNDLASLLHDMAIMDRIASKWDEAEQLYRESLAFAERVYGKEHGFYVTALNNMASLLQDQGQRQRDEIRLGRAEAMFRESLALRERLDGPQSARYANALGNLAVLLIARQRPADAVPLLQKALLIRQRVNGPQHKETLKTRVNLVHAVLQAEGGAAALPLARELQVYVDALRALDRSLCGLAVLCCVDVYVVAREWQAALDLGTPVYAEFSALWGAGGVNTKGLVRRLAQACTGLGRADEAAAWTARIQPK